MKSKYIFLVCFLLFVIALNSQEKKGYFAEQIIVGTATSIVPNSSAFDRDLVHLEISWLNNISISLTKRIHLGAEYRFIRTSGSTTAYFAPDPTNYFMAGIFTQLDVLETERLRIFGQLGYDIGNYCACDRLEDPFKVEDRRYAGWGLGLNYRIYKFFSLDAQIYYNYVINKEDYNPYVYGYWALGINYDLNRKRE